MKIKSGKNSALSCFLKQLHGSSWGILHLIQTQRSRGVEEEEYSSQHRWSESTPGIFTEEDRLSIYWPYQHKTIIKRLRQWCFFPSPKAMKRRCGNWTLLRCPALHALQDTTQVSCTACTAGHSSLALYRTGYVCIHIYLYLCTYVVLVYSNMPIADKSEKIRCSICQAVHHAPRVGQN